MTGFDTEYVRGDIAEARDLIVAMAVRLPLKYRDHEPTLVLFDELAALRERVAALQAQLEALDEIQRIANDPRFSAEYVGNYFRSLRPSEVAGRGVREPEQETT